VKLRLKVKICRRALGFFYLSDVVRVVFCTLSASAHPLLVVAFRFHELIIDEFARESLGGLAIVFGAYKDTIEHVTIADDYKPIVGAYAAQHSNLGHCILSRKIFHEATNPPRQTCTIVKLGSEEVAGKKR
jgi:hypothetical protein